MVIFLQVGGIKHNKLKNLSKPLKGHFSSVSLEPMCHLVESRVESIEAYKVGQPIDLGHFSGCESVDVTSHSKGRDFKEL